MSTLLETRPSDPELDQGEPKFAHIVHNKNSITEAYILGTPLEALCGRVFVPSRDPKTLPVCEQCKDIFRDAGGTPEEVTP